MVHAINRRAQHFSLVIGVIADCYERHDTTWRPYWRVSIMYCPHTSCMIGVNNSTQGNSTLTAGAADQSPLGVIYYRESGLTIHSQCTQQGGAAPHTLTV